MTDPIRLLNPSIDDFDDKVVFRGVVDVDSLAHLRLDHYQRELLPASSRRHIAEALVAGERLPDVTLGMRGDRFEMDGPSALLLDPVFIIDGRQRRDTILERLACDGAPRVRLGAVVHLNTNPIWERDLFRKLNEYQKKVSPNVLLRNLHEDHAGLATMYGLTKSDRNFVLYNRVCWTQNMARGELLTATTLLTVLLTLHARIAPGSGGYSVSVTVPVSDRLIQKIGMPIFRENVKTFYNLIDECWGIKRIAIKGGAPYMRRTFMTVLARLLNDHLDFWKQPDDRRLVIGYELKRKLGKFPIDDPEIVRLASTGGAAAWTLYSHLLNHVNSGKRTRHLCSRSPVAPAPIPDEEDEDVEVA